MSSRPFAILLAFAIAAPGGTALAGHYPVDPVGPVFTPVPSVFQTLPVPLAGVAGAAGSGEGGAAAGTTDATAGAATADALRFATGFCGALSGAYAVSCLADMIGRAAKDLPDTADYAGMKTALASASTRLEAVAKAARDPEEPRINARVEGPRPMATSRPLTPVRPAEDAAVKARALAIIEETQTVLLRSSTRSEVTRASFVEVAAALDSNKVLLRS